MKWQFTKWEKIVANHISDKKLISGISEDPLQLINKRTSNPVKSGQRV